MAKIFLQEIWKLGLDWDEAVPAEIDLNFKHWMDGLGLLRQWIIPRCYTTRPWLGVTGLELHAFGDASEKGYGSTVYLRIPKGDGGWQVSFVISRARVAPLKRITLPRLELLGALLSARLVVYVRDALQLPEVEYRCWTDSTVALSWIQGDAYQWKPFVANRVAEIQSLTSPSHWYHCPGKENPADLLTRGLYAQDLVASCAWLEGPEWLVTGHQEDYTSPQTHEEPEVAQEKLCLAVVSPNVIESPFLQVERWGKFTKAIRIMGWILRLRDNFKKKKDRNHGKLSYEELDRAKCKLFYCIQQEAYRVECANLREGKPLSRSSPLYKLCPFVGDNGLMRIKGRLQRSSLTYEEKHPVLLPKGHLTKLLIRDQHLRLKHAGVDTVVTALRNTYWIVGARRLAKTVKRECAQCQRVDARACNQVAAPLPEVRVRQAPPFTVTGLDYAGPLYCADSPGKKYILLLTCAAVRAIHLELTDTLALPEFMLALRRFVARRGVPSVIYSDNAKVFKAAKEQLYASFGDNRPEWRYIVPRAPWWGGWWERMVRTVKSA